MVDPDRFLSPQNLLDRATLWSRELELMRNQQTPLHAPALLVLDMQNEFLLPTGQLPVWGGPAIIANVQALIETFRMLRRPVIFTRHICLEPGRHREKIAIMGAVDNPSTVLQESHKSSALHEAIRPHSNECVIIKYAYSAFYNTPLETLLRAADTREVVVTGVATNVCCETTAHDAFFRSYDVICPIDATGGTDERAHLASLRNIRWSYGCVTTTKQLIDSLNRMKQSK